MDSMAFRVEEQIQSIHSQEQMMSLVYFRKLLCYIELLRPLQWIKNSIVFVVFFFVFWDKKQNVSFIPAFFHILLLFIVLCMISSSVYSFNDVMDMEKDKEHPLKRNRPVARGCVSIKEAVIISFFMFFGGMFIGIFMFTMKVLGILLLYFVMQIIYTSFLKKLAFIDIFVIAIGFVLRAVSGALAIGDIDISPWLIVCTFFLALFIAICKRLSDRLIMEKYGLKLDIKGEATLSYDETILSSIAVMGGTVTLVCYAIYTLWPTTVEKFGTDSLSVTIPFAAFGIFRYFALAKGGKTSQPEYVLVSDIPMIVTLILYCLVISVIYIFGL